MKKKKMEEHMAECFSKGGTKVIKPEIGKNIIEFTNYSQQQESPFCIYADFESIMKKESERKMIHEISGYSLCVKSPYEKPQIASYRGADAGEVFMKKLESLGKELNKKIKNVDAKIIYGEGEKNISRP